MASAVAHCLKEQYNLASLPIFADENSPDYINKITRMSLNDTDVKYAFFPVWMLSTKWKKKNYVFVLNGQTGKIVSDLPCDNFKALKRFLRRFLLIFGIGLALSAFIWMIVR